MAVRTTLITCVTVTLNEEARIVLVASCVCVYDVCRSAQAIKNDDQTVMYIGV